MKNKNGFTMVELIIVVAIFGLVFIVVTSTLFNIIKAALKTEALKEVRQNGDVAMSRITKDLREATSITACGGGNTISFDTVDNNDDIVSYTYSVPLVGTSRQLQRSRIFPLPVENEFILDQKNVNLPADTSLTFTCTSVSSNPPDQIRIQLTLQYVPFGNAALIQENEDRAQTRFETTVVNRNFSN